MGRRELSFYFGAKQILKLVIICSISTILLAGNDTRKETASKLGEARQLREAGKFAESLKVLENEVSQKPGGKSSS
ncbi:MAG: hypothetical protein KBI45_09700, partial [Candidatus Saccharicenans sp.]|nr:hypothetical protein [Candidatus Saccharicenans sp.]